MIPFVNLKAQREAYRDEFLAAERDVLESGCYIGGPQVSALEKEISEFCGIDHVITCGSGTDALTIALLTLGLKSGDEVIVPDFTFIAPAECVASLGGVPKFADIDKNTLEISTESVKKLITPATKGIIAVNLFGQCAPFEELRKIADHHGLWLLEDAAQAFGATRHGKMACTLGDIGITSFYPSKPLGCYGDGGALFTNNANFASKIRTIANHGSKSHYLHERIGLNSRLDAIQAGILRVKLRHLTDELAKRNENAQKYNDFFSEMEGILPQRILEGNTSSYAQYTLLINHRKDFLKQLDLAEIPYCIHYPMPLHRQPCFEGAGRYEEYCSNDICEKVVSLPVCPFTDVEAIIEKMRTSGVDK